MCGRGVLVRTGVSLPVTDVVSVGTQLEKGFVIDPSEHYIIQPRVTALRVVAGNGVSGLVLDDSDEVIVDKGIGIGVGRIRPSGRIFNTDLDLTDVGKLLEEVIKEILIHDQSLTSRQVFVERDPTAGFVGGGNGSGLVLRGTLHGDARYCYRRCVRSVDSGAPTSKRVPRPGRRR